MSHPAFAGVIGLMVLCNFAKYPDMDHRRRIPMLKQKIIKACLLAAMVAFHPCLNTLVLAEDWRIKMV